MRELFVYYRVRSADAAAARAAVNDVQAQLRAELPGLVARLLRRPEEADGCQTWMETYATDPDLDRAGIDAARQASIEARAAALAPFLAGPRHVEAFIACAC